MSSNSTRRMAVTAAAAAALSMGAIGAATSVFAAETGVSVSTNSNDPAYWEAAAEAKGYTDVQCTKLDKSMNTSEYTVNGDYILLVLKAGSGDGANTVFWNPVNGQTYQTADGKDISHIILCTGTMPTESSSPPPSSDTSSTTSDTGSTTSDTGSTTSDTGSTTSDTGSTTSDTGSTTSGTVTVTPPCTPTTVTVPGPTVTVPGGTVTVPGGTVTVPGPTVTVPGGTVTVPGVTVTETVTATQTRSGTATVPPPVTVTETVTGEPSTVTTTVPGTPGGTNTVNPPVTVTVTEGDDGGPTEGADTTVTRTENATVEVIVEEGSGPVVETDAEGGGPTPMLLILGGGAIGAGAVILGFGSRRRTARH